MLAVWALAGWALSAGALRAKDSGRPLAGLRPNLIVILTDDQGYGDLGCHGNPVLKTPRLDRLHAESARLIDFHVSPTCAPTRAALLTGRHEFRSGVTHTISERERLALSAVTLAQLLQQAGYQTGIFGKWHLGDETDYRPDRRGFIEYFIHGAGGIGQTFPGSCGDAPGNRYTNPVMLHNGRFEATQGYCTDVFFERALGWIASVRTTGPFYCQLATHAPHAPLNCPEQYAARYRSQVKTPEQAKFLGMIANIDDNVGRLLDRLAEWELERSTLVVFLNDNGGTVGVPIWNAGLRGSKGTAYEGGTRAAGFLRWPGTIEPGDRPGLTAHVDVFPTLLELAGVSPPKDLALDGRSLVPLLVDERAEWPRRTLVTHVGRWPPGEMAAWKYRQASIRRDRWHLVWVDGPPGELFDLARDPGEAQDLAAQQPGVVAELTAEFDRWWESILPCQVNEDAYRTAPAQNAFKTLYWEQFAGPGPNGVPPPSGR